MTDTTKYNVIVLHCGMNAVLTHKDKDEWSLRTAKKYANEFKAQHGNDCNVIDASLPIHLAKVIYTTKKEI